MTIWVIRDGDIIGYERLGECLGCGECCSRFSYACEMGTSPKEVGEDGGCADLSQHEDWAIEDWDDPNKWRWWGPFKIEDRKEPCESFDANVCKIWKADEWPEICRKFPLRPEDLEGLTNCGFRFERLEA